MLCRCINLVGLIFLIYQSTLIEISFSLPLSAYEPKDGQRVGFFTGTFNPVHQRHAEIAFGLLDQRLLDVLIIVPNDMTYHKTSVIDISHRIQMLEFQFEDAINIFVPDSADFGGSKFIPIELRMRSYIHTLNPNLEYFGVIGADCVDSKSVNLAVHVSKLLSSANDHIKYWYISTAIEPKFLVSRSQFFRTSGEYVYIPTANEIHSTKIRNYF